MPKHVAAIWDSSCVYHWCSHSIKMHGMDSVKPAEGVGEWGAEGGIWAQEGGNDREVGGGLHNEKLHDFYC